MKKKNQNKEAKKTQEDVDRWHNEIRKTKPKANKQKKNHEESQHRNYIKSSGILEMYISVLKSMK